MDHIRAGVAVVRIIGLTGTAGCGKSAAAAALVERAGFSERPLAAGIKRICAHVFGWDDARLNGPSENRNAPDPEWNGLTARYALQALGTEWGRRMHPDVWVRHALRYARLDLSTEEGRLGPTFRGVVIPDVRFSNEAAAIRAAGGKVVRITRPGAGLQGAAGAHASEAGIPDELVDLELPNTGPLWLLQARAVKLPAVLFGSEAFT